MLEGVTYGLRDSLELMRGLGVPVRQVRASGGGARSPLWRQILADVFGTELVTVNVTEGAAYGAALLAGVGAQVYHSVEDACARTVKITGSTEPTAAAASLRRLLPALPRALPGAGRGVRRAGADGKVIGESDRLRTIPEGYEVRRSGF